MTIAACSRCSRSSGTPEHAARMRRVSAGFAGRGIGPRGRNAFGSREERNIGGREVVGAHMRRFVLLIAIFATVIAVRAGRPISGRRGSEPCPAGCVSGVRFRRLHRAVALSARRLDSVALPCARDLCRRRQTARAATGTSPRRGSRARSASGWSLLPLYVGLQAPCVGQAGLKKIGAALGDRARRRRSLRCRRPRGGARTPAGHTDLLRHGGLQDERSALLAGRSRISSPPG